MNLKTSFFNKSMYRSDMKRLWWISAIEAIFIFLSWSFPIMEYISKLSIYSNIFVKIILSVIIVFIAFYPRNLNPKCPAIR